LTEDIGKTRYLSILYEPRPFLLAILIIIGISLEIVVHYFWKIEVVYTHFYYVIILFAGLWYGRKVVLVAFFFGSLDFILSYLVDGAFTLEPLLRLLIMILVALIVGTVVDEMKSFQEQVQEQNTRLIALNRELKELNRKANLYLDIYLDVITYEIFNAITTLWSYAEYLKTSAGTEERKLAERIISLSKKSSNVIRNVETISRIYKTPIITRKVDLSTIVQKEVALRPEAHIHIEDCNYPVLADDMLGVVFNNLFANSLKFGGPDVEITVSGRNTGEGLVEISVTDNGKGIPDAMKPLIFDRFIDDSKARSSYGLGLHIVKMLIEGYGGRIWAADRVSGMPEQGAAIIFTLRLAEKERED
jgi:signal transduction histidine kinase